jgi:Icc protein
LTGVRLVQLTDTHLTADPAGTLKGVHVRGSLEAVVDLVRANEPDFGAFLLTGDLSHDETMESYRYLSSLLAPFGRPVLALAGNHDDPEAMDAGFRAAGNGVRTGRAHRLGQWDVLLADSRLPGATAGALSPGELGGLDDALGAEPERPVLLALHHHPVPTGSVWMDELALANPEALFGLLDRHPRVRCVVWGHVHQEQDVTRGGVRMLAAPATCIQFRPGMAEFTLDDAPPGYRWIDLGPDGTVATGVRRLPAAP